MTDSKEDQNVQMKDTSIIPDENLQEAEKKRWTSGFVLNHLSSFKKFATDAGAVDDILWDGFQDYFEHWDTSNFKLAGTTDLNNLRIFLRQRGLYVVRKKGFIVARALFNVLNEKHPAEWPEDELFNQIKKGSFYSRQIPQATVNSPPADPQTSNTPQGDPPSTYPLGFNNFPTNPPLPSTPIGNNQPRVNNTNRNTIYNTAPHAQPTVPGATTNNPVNLNTFPPPPPPSIPSDNSSQQTSYHSTQSSNFPSNPPLHATFSPDTSNFHAPSRYNNFPLHQNLQQNNTQNPHHVQYNNQHDERQRTTSIMNLYKIYRDGIKYGSQNDNLNSALDDFHEMCSAAGVPDDYKGQAISIMLKDSAKLFYSENIRGKISDFNEIVNAIRRNFETPELQREMQSMYNSITLSKISAEHKELKSKSECLEELVREIQRLHRGFPAYRISDERNDLELRNTTTCCL
ncbi:hypothetical protein K3495_g5836 [Podosphaera aphanis]|nr:hypothetical protein K3495_g5836 [Podosphaera aphanis]